MGNVLSFLFKVGLVRFKHAALIGRALDLFPSDIIARAVPSSSCGRPGWSSLGV